VKAPGAIWPLFPVKYKKHLLSDGVGLLLTTRLSSSARPQGKTSSFDPWASTMGTLAGSCDSAGWTLIMRLGPFHHLSDQIPTM